MSRLGLLAAAFSDGRVVVYALPHPGALHNAKTTQVKGRKSHTTEQGLSWPFSPCARVGLQALGLGTSVHRSLLWGDPGAPSLASVTDNSVGSKAAFLGVGGLL